MLGPVGSAIKVPHSLVAPSLRELHRRMLLNNIRDSKQYEYFDIQKDGKNWVAFFVKEAAGTFGQMLSEVLDKKQPSVSGE